MFYHVLALGLVVAKPTEERPNFVVIVTDSFDGRVVENKSYKPIVDLKNIEKLQDQGTTYQRTYCDYPICCPSRTALLSGRRNDVTHAWNNHEGLDPNFRNWTTDFRENGYNMAFYGKMDDQTGSHSESERVESWTRNVDFALRQDPRPVAQTTGDMNTRRVNKKDWENFDDAKNFLDSVSNQSEPFFLYWGIYSPHPYDSIWEDGPQAGASTFLSSPHYLSRIRQNQIRLPKWNDFENEHPVDKYAIVTKNCSGDFQRGEILAVRKHYYAMLAEVDEMIGDIVQAIPKDKLDNTIIIFTSDHGELAMEHRQYYKMSFYEGSARVPLVISGPTFKRGHTVDSPATLLDIYPTLLDAARLPYKAELDGVGLNQATPIPSNRPIISHYHGEHMNSSAFMVYQDNIKLIYYTDASNQLFNLTSDPDELTPIENPEVESRLFELLKKTLVHTPDDIAEEVKSYNKRSFRNWKASKGTNYVNAISNLRWEIDFKKDQTENLEKIEKWLGK